MNGCNLILKPDEDDRAVWLITQSANEIRQKDLVWLREGFGLQEVREALLATGWVKPAGDQLRFTGASPRGRLLSDVLEEIFDYFSAPNVPTIELLDVQAAVSAYAVAHQSSLDVPLYAYAWLDIMVREDMADEARSVTNIWCRSSVAIELDRKRERRVAELFSRFARPASRAAGRLAGSLPTRSVDPPRATKSG